MKQSVTVAVRLFDENFGSFDEVHFPKNCTCPYGYRICETDLNNVICVKCPRFHAGKQDITPEKEAMTTRRYSFYGINR
jgi:hypothetical protein